MSVNGTPRPELLKVVCQPVFAVRNADGKIVAEVGTEQQIVLYEPNLENLRAITEGLIPRIEQQLAQQAAQQVARPVSEGTRDVAKRKQRRTEPTPTKES